MKVKSFFLDDQKISSSQYIFDDVYKTQRDKRAFSNNPKFTYFNQIIKLKKKYQDDKPIYSSVFQSQNNHNLDFRNTFSNISFGKTTPLFHNEKLNIKSFGFKNYRPNYNNIPQIHDISFNSQEFTKGYKVYINNRPKLEEIMAQYRRMNKQNKAKKQSRSKEKRKMLEGQKMIKLYEKNLLSKSLQKNK